MCAFTDIMIHVTTFNLAFLRGSYAQEITGDVAGHAGFVNLARGMSDAGLAANERAHATPRPKKRYGEHLADTRLV